MSQVKQNKTVFVGMSGGVDSSVAAWLLTKKGYNVIGVFMRCYNIDGCAEKDAEDARRVAGHIGIPFYVWDFEEAYKRKVMDYMIEGYRNGITPNPDVMCNKEIKFGLFLEKALAAGADHVATGHYVKLKETRNKGRVTSKKKSMSHVTCRMSLFEATDKNKDQSYFLWTLTQKQLKYCLFPIGDYDKPDVREIARKAGLPTAEKKDSQGICFLGDVSIADFLKQYIPERRGTLVTTNGEKIGQHSGAEFYTVGQRHIGGDFTFPKTGTRADREPFYVAAKDASTNTVTLAEGSGNAALYRKEIELIGVNFIDSSYASGNELAKKGMKIFARVRYRQPLFSAVLSSRVSDRFHLVFDKRQKFIAPGQSAVWYSKKGETLGGGIILDAL